MRVNGNVVALNMQNMMLKNNSISNLSMRKLKISKEEDAVELVISEKMKAQIRDFNNAEGFSCDEQTSLNEAITTVQDITGILGEIQEVLQAIQERTSLKKENISLTDQFEKLQLDFVNVSNSEIFNSKWFEDGLISNNRVVSNDFNTCNIDEIKKLANQYESKLEELEKLNREFKNKIDTGQVTQNNLSAAESHVHNIATAEEVVNETKSFLMNETRVAMLSQANKRPEQVKMLLE